MPRKTKKIKEDQEKVEKDVSTLHSVRMRINRVIGQLETAKTREEKQQLYLELHSARRALESANRQLEIDILQEMMDFIEAGNIKEALAVGNNLLGIMGRNNKITPQK